jgi:hypothetical protein
MPRSRGLGRLSYRGVFALCIGLVFIWFALNPQHFNDDVPPVFVIVIMFVAGAALSYGGAVSLRFVWRRGNLVRSSSSVAAEICVLEDDDTDRGTDTVHVRIGGRCQALGVDPSGVVRKFADGQVRWGEAWLDDNGKVHAVVLSGSHLNTLIGGREIPAAQFGVKE